MRQTRPANAGAVPDGLPVRNGSTWGVWLEPELPPRQSADLARQIEEAGASHLFLADEGLERDVFVTLTAIAQATSRLVLATGITNPFTRHPAALAAAFATLAELAPGRVVAGLGVGGSRVLVPMGIDSRKPYTWLSEAVAVIDRLLGGEEVDHEGAFSLRGARLAWSKGRLPLAVAGRGPKVEHLGATQAAWVLFSGKPLVDLASAAERVRAAAKAAGNKVSIGWSSYLAWNPAMVDEVRQHFTYIATDAPEETRRASGLDDERGALVRAVMLEKGMAEAAHLIPDEVVRYFAVVGDKDGVVRTLHDLRVRVAPELFILPINDYSRPGEFIESAAELLRAAGFKEAS